MVSLDTAYFVENWKYYSKIIFKCMNNAVGLIFNESFVKKKVCDSQEQCMESLESTKRASQWRKKKKKKRWNADALCFNCTQTNTENPVFMSYGTTSLLTIKIKKDFAFGELMFPNFFFYII